MTTLQAVWSREGAHSIQTRALHLIALVPPRLPQRTAQPFPQGFGQLPVNRHALNQGLIGHPGSGRVVIKNQGREDLHAVISAEAAHFSVTNAHLNPTLPTHPWERVEFLHLIKRRDGFHPDFTQTRADARKGLGGLLYPPCATSPPPA